MDKVQNILDQVKDYSLNELSELIYRLKDIYRDKYRGTYRTIDIYNMSCNIVDRIKSETGYSCYYLPAERSGCIGTNVIEVPLDKYTEDLEKELIDKYTNV